MKVADGWNGASRGAAGPAVGAAAPLPAFQQHRVGLRP